MFADENGLNEPIDFIFDKQIGHQVLMSARGRHLSRLVGEDPIFRDEKERKLLQAAECLASAESLR
ncbi:MAG: hypothetical protein ACLQLO_20505 [Mycobacterium sp.]